MPQQSTQTPIDDAPPQPMAPGKVALLQRGQELLEFTQLLDELGIPYESFAEDLPRIEDLQEVRLILASTERLLESGPPHLSNWPRTIAVIQDPSKTLSAHLGRIGVSMILCRPIHPQAMRLILLHEVYRGPEKRVRGRTLIGQPVRLRAGLFSSKGTILDLSPSGARIQMTSAPKVGSKMRLLLGAELNGGKPLKLATQVVRVGRPKDAEGNKTAFAEVGLSILDAKKNQKPIAAILQHFAFGPGRWTDVGRQNPGGAADPNEVSHPDGLSQTDVATPVDCDEGATDISETSSVDANEDASDSPRRLPPTAARRAAPVDKGISIQAAKPAPKAQKPNPAEPELPPQVQATSAADAERARAALIEEENWNASADAGATVEFDDAAFDDDFSDATNVASEVDEAGEDGADRRTNQRVPYDRRIVALGEEAARVLVGQDLSRGGMRVLSRDGVSVGDLLKVALHCGTMMEPVVVAARAVREHGEDGMILNFEDLTDSQIEHLEKIVASSGPIQYMADDEDSDGTNDSEGPVVVGELLDHVPAAEAEA